MHERIEKCFTEINAPAYIMIIIIIISSVTSRRQSISISIIITSIYSQIYMAHVSHCTVIEVLCSAVRASITPLVHSLSKESLPNRPDKSALYGRKNRTRSAIRSLGRSSYSLLRSQPVEVPKEGKYVLTAAVIRSLCCLEPCE